MNKKQTPNVSKSVKMSPAHSPFRKAARTVVEVNRKALETLKDR